MFPRIASHIILTTQFTDTANHKSTKTADQPVHASLSAMSTRASAPSSKRNDASTNRADLSFASLLHWLHLLPNFSYIEVSNSSSPAYRQTQAASGTAETFYLRGSGARVWEAVHNDFCREPEAGFPALRE